MNREEQLRGKRDRERQRRKDNPEEYKLRKQNQYYNQPGYAERVMRRIREKRLANPEEYLYKKARSRAKKKGLRFNLDLEDIVIPKKCPVLGIEMGPLLGKKHGATIDRINNSKGYIRGNIVVISKRANTIKSNASIDELIRIANFYSKHKS